MTFPTRSLILAASLLPAAGLALPAAAQTAVRCYGVALAGQNDGLDDRDAPKTSQVDWQGNAFVMLPQAQCLRMALPVQPDGTPRRGAVEPLARDAPPS